MYRILSTEQQKVLETKPADRLLPLDSRPRALPRQHLLSARGRRRRLPAHPGQDQDARAARHSDAALRARRQAPRARARHRADRLGQVDDARLAARPHQPLPARAHPHDRGPDRVPAPPRDLHRQPARDRPGRDDVRRGAARRTPPGPRRDPRRRDARPRDGLDRAHGRRDRAPRVRHPAHAERADHDRPRHRRLPRRAAGPGARAARLDAAGRRHAEPHADRRRPRPHRRARGADARRRRPQPDPAGEGRADLLGHADEHLARHADDGAVARRPRAAQRHHARGGLRALVAARPASGPARALRHDELDSHRLPATAAPTATRPQRRAGFGSPRRCSDTWI